MSHTFIQWKGTTVCMDFECDCGHSNHYCGYKFGYWAECFGCKKVFTVGTEVSMTEVSDMKEVNPDCVMKDES